MPFYDFTCENDKCINYNKKDERHMSMTEYEATKDTLTCSICGLKLRRIFNGEPMAKFKGTGFYCTDYK